MNWVSNSCRNSYRLLKKSNLFSRQFDFIYNLCGIVNFIRTSDMSKQKITILNGVEIFAEITENGQVYIPVKPICQAIGVDPEAQRQRILRHYILSSTAFTLKAVAADEKEREMLCLPLDYIYGWLFTIDANLVSEANREKVADYQRECYDILYRHFAGSLRRRVEENEAEIAALQAVNDAILKVKNAKAEQRKAEENLAEIRKSRLDSTPQLEFD